MHHAGDLAGCFTKFLKMTKLSENYTKLAEKDGNMGKQMKNGNFVIFFLFFKRFFKSFLI